jgi:hypothetical protein
MENIKMELEQDFVFRPLPPVENTNHFPFPFVHPIFPRSPLGPLASLAGSWSGKGFNMIWRPHFPKAPQDRFLELNLTNDAIKFEAISGPIPNRGLLQPDMNMFGLTYLQQIQDGNVHAGLHIEPGIWAVVPTTTDPAEPATVVRMASIPHGTTILAQGTSSFKVGGPVIPNNNIFPFPIGGGAPITTFPEQKLATPSVFRSQPPQTNGISQSMLDNPNSVLQEAIVGQDILFTTELSISTTPSPIVGGGTSNTAFLSGAGDGPNAVAAAMSATFWIEVIKGTPNKLQLQYTQLVLLNFNGLSWPHVTVGTLLKESPIELPILKIDPDIPAELLKAVRPDFPVAIGAPVRNLVDPPAAPDGKK